MPYRDPEMKRQNDLRKRGLTSLAQQALHMLALASDRGELFDPSDQGIHSWQLVALERRGLARRESEDLWRPTLKGLVTARKAASDMAPEIH